ncbi:MAG: response regulator [bacterium]|nr:response regulator [bacterium]
MSTSLFILDDDLYFGRCLKKELEAIVDEVKHFKTERNFLKALETPPNIIILDYHLEQSTGLEMIHQMEKKGVNAEILLVSGQEDVSVKLKAYKKGALGYFEKYSGTCSEVRECIEWILRVSYNFDHPIERKEFREMWLKRENVGWRNPNFHSMP